MPSLPASPPRPVRLLLVEDSLDVIELTKEFLELGGKFVVDAVTHALDFWTQIESREYDVLLLDYNLPDTNGLDILKELAARGIRTPVIIITGHGDETIASKTVQAGAAEYVVKQGDYLEMLPGVIARVNEQARLKRALDEAESRRRDLFEQASEGILICDMDGIILEANQTLCRWLDRPPESLTGRGLAELMCAERAGAAQDLCARLARAGSLVYEGTYCRGDGATFPVEISARWVQSRGKDHPAFLQFFIRDITRRREMQAEILRRTRTLAALSDITAAINRSLELNDVLDAALAGILSALEIDCGAIYLDHDPLRLAAVRGFSANFVGRMGQLHPADWTAMRHVPASANRRDEWVMCEGVRAYLACPLTAKQHAIGLILLASRDRDSFTQDECDFVNINCDRITAAIENARLFDDLQQSLEALRQAQAHVIRAARLTAVGELAAGVAHQISNPLTTILADAQLLLKTVGPDHTAYPSASAIFQAGWRAQRVVQRLLNFSSPTESDYAPTDVNESVLNALDLVGAQFERSKIDLRLALAPDLPPVPAHAHQLEEVWINLLMNAREAVADWPAAVIQLTSQLASSGAAVEVEVTDNGHGIAEAERAQIFNPFFTTKGNGRGNGLGLSVSQSIIANHGGEITFRSQPGQGTTFVVRLPLARKTR